MRIREVRQAAGHVLGGGLACILLASCAGQAPPPGGPEDRTPPEIQSSSPAPYATHYTERLIAFEFSEYVDRRSVEGAIFISPHVGTLEFDWSGREVEITFSDSLKENTTYVVTVGTDVVDLRNRNRMERALSLAFSTGGAIDRGAISGLVYPESEGAATSGLLVMAYRLDGLSADTLNPCHTKPDYVTQTGAAGEFALPHLRLGRYRLLALRDEYRNLLYDPQTDAFGLLASDIELTENDTSVSGLAIKMAVQDTTGPTLIKATGRSLHMIELQFSEPLQEEAISADALEVVDTLSGRRLEVLAAAVRRPEREFYLVATSPQDTLAVYRMTVRSVRDSAGNHISPLANSLHFIPASALDTARLRVAGVSISDSARALETRPVLELSFNRPAKDSVPAGAVTLADTLGRRVPTELAWRGSLTLSVRPVRALSSGAWYVLSVQEGALVDVFGGRGRDTTVAVSFEVISADRLGSIEGTVVDESVTDATGPVVVLAQSAGGSAHRVVRQTIARPGPFTLSEVPEGRYRIGGFRDRNANALYDAGTVFPYTPAERFRLAPDTLRVRARWPYEGASVRLR